MNTKPSRWMDWFVFLGGWILLLGGLGGTAALFGWQYAFGGNRFLVDELGQMAGLILGVVGGSLAIIHGGSSLVGKISGKLHLPPFYLFWAAFAAVLGLGSLQLNLKLFETTLFPVIFALGASLPTLAVLSWAWQRLGWPLTWRQGSLSIISGASLSVLVVIILSTVLSLLLYMLISPLGFLFFALISLANSGNSFFEYLFTSSPLVFYLIYTALLAPVPEEFAKALGPILFGRRRIRNTAQALAVGMASGAGFAILENMLYQGVYAEMNEWAWGGITLVRAFGVVMHALCTGMVALGWYRMREQGFGSLLKAYGLAVLIHTLWNGGFEVLVYLFGLSFYSDSVSLYGLYVNVLLIGYIVLLTAGLWVMLGHITRMARQPEEVVIVDGGGLTPRTMGAWALACAFVLVPLGAALGQAWPHISAVLAP